MGTKIEDRTITKAKKDAKATSKRVEIRDSIVLGLQLRVTPGGAASFSIVTRVKGGNGEQIRLTYRKWESVAEVRELARQDLGKAERGVDPRPGRRGAKDLVTFQDLYDRWLELHAKKQLKSWQQLDQRARHMVLPELGHLKLEALMRDRRPISRVIWTVVDSGRISSAARALTLISGVFSWAVRREELPINPCRGMAYPKEPASKTRRALDEAALRTLWLRFSEDAKRDPWSGKGSPGAPHYLAMIMMSRLLLGQRTEEIICMRWDDLDLVGGWWNMPERFDLGGREVKYTKNGRPHRVPLLGLWLEYVRPLIEGARQEGPWVFPSPRKKGWPLEANAVGGYCRKVAGDTGIAFSARNFRTTLVTSLRRLGVDRERVQKLINHVSGAETIDRHYDLHSYDTEKVEAMRVYDAHLRPVLFGEEARVLPLARSSRRRGQAPR